jgi:peptidoglycan/LPS O-acetylase OafA/YrhL
MSFALTLHSILRWATIIVAVAALIKFGIGWFGKKPYDDTANRLRVVFTSLMDVQLLLGGFYLVLGGLLGFGWPAYRLEHLGIMLVAVVLAHLTSLGKEKGDNVRYRNGFLFLLASLVVVVVGVSLLPGGRWLTITGLF